MPVETKKDSELIKTVLDVANNMESLSRQNLIKQMGEVIGKDLSKADFFKDFNKIIPISVAGTTDAAQFIKANKNMELAICGPGVPMLNHALNERLPIKQYLDFIEAYKKIIEQYMN